ncbi:6-phytase [Granulibacter bethesdensis]|uniref:6-phytase n=2 Tax=Granulibacter bethesdensis TaxID=364410 RepID=A0AAN0VFZ1_9PROT|nr:6-phytase [Granulibacter bethesdensis]
MRFKFHTLLALCILSTTLSSHPASAQTMTLRKVVALVRHSIRSQDIGAPNSLAAPYSPLNWPTYGVSKGNLTATGTAFAKNMGGYYADLYATLGLKAASQCPPTSNGVFVWSDNRTPRTIATGTAFLTGAFPGCGLSAHFYQSTSNDPLFYNNISLTAGTPSLSIAPQMNVMMQIMGAPTGDTYTSSNNPCNSSTSSPSQTTCADVGDYADEFRLQYASGLAVNNIAWGSWSSLGIAKQQILNEIQLYTQWYMADYRAQTNGVANGTFRSENIANQIALALSQLTTPGTSGGPPTARLVLFVGHDSTVQALGSLMNASWTSPDGVSNDSPPVSGFVFELYSDSSGNFFVRPRFITATLDQMRQNRRLTANGSNNPGNSTLIIPGCTTQSVDRCSASTFISILNTAIASTGITPTTVPYN